ncbi:DUF1990 domain-containing protein [Nocardia sp. CDC153]|uniref:DUF1990 family protein n=1 Tax=Nocardia sp. CDC153 TaxID=3112167 RepID=UPI002DB9792D|nr:DUF1990 domain-containing protein [Nocardia sp. CDC153]MEC3954141.1 DUF1990 domain-containing protein [Nocardia sp. CDC153]
MDGSPTTAEFSYDVPGATEPGETVWAGAVPGFRRFERTVVVGRGDDCWERLGAEVLRWGVKRRSGFRVAALDEAGSVLDDADLRVTPGANFRITAGWGPITVREPVRVVEVVETAMRVGFSYGTLPGHPVSGEEAFVLHRDGDAVRLTLRSLTRPAPGGTWRVAFPALLLAQCWYRARYLRVLKED